MTGVGAFACGVVVAWAAVLSLIDVRRRRLPNALTLPGAAAVLAGAAVVGHGPSALAGGAALTAVYGVVHLAAPAAMGAGDVKLAIGLGALTGAFGPEVWVLAALAAPLLTAVLGVLTLLRRGAGTVPHGPSMCAASLLAAALPLL